MQEIKNLARGSNENILLRYLLLSRKEKEWPYAIAKELSDENSKHYIGRKIAAYDISQAEESLLRKKLIFSESVPLTQRHLLRLTPKGLAASLYLNEDFVSDTPEESAMEHVRRYFEINDLSPPSLLACFRKFATVTDKLSGNIFARYWGEYLLRHDVFDNKGIFDFGDYAERDFRRMFLSCISNAHSDKRFVAADDKNSANLMQIANEYVADLVEEGSLDEEKVEELYKNLKNSLVDSHSKVKALLSKKKEVNGSPRKAS